MVVLEGRDAPGPEVVVEGAAVPFALAEWIAALTQERRVIVFLDDVHLTDEGSLSVAHRILEGLEDAIDEMRYCKEAGLKSVVLRSFPTGGSKPTSRSPI